MPRMIPCDACGALWQDRPIDYVQAPHQLTGLDGSKTAKLCQRCDAEVCCECEQSWMYYREAFDEWVCPVCGSCCEHVWVEWHRGDVEIGFELAPDHEDA